MTLSRGPQGSKWKLQTIGIHFTILIWPGSGDIGSLATLVLKIGHICGDCMGVSFSWLYKPTIKRASETCVELDLLQGGNRILRATSQANK